MPEGELVEQDGPQGEAPRLAEATGGDVAQTAENSLELAIKVLDGMGAELMENATHLDPIVGMGIGGAFGGDQQPAVSFDQGGQGRVVVVLVAQNGRDLLRQRSQQHRGVLIVGDVGRSESGGHGQPDGVPDGDHQMQLPPIDSPVPARFGPVGLGVNARMRHKARLALLLVPDAAAGTQHRRVEGDRPSAVRPGVTRGSSAAPRSMTKVWPISTTPATASACRKTTPSTSPTSRQSTPRKRSPAFSGPRPSSKGRPWSARVSLGDASPRSLSTSSRGRH